MPFIAAFWIATGSVSLAGNTLAPVIEPDIVRPAPLTLDLQGLYAGGDIAYAFGGEDEVGHRAPSGVLVSSPGELEMGGFNYGLRLGWRNTVPVGRSHYVYGFELGYDAGDISDSFTTTTQSASVDLKRAFSFRFKSGATNFRGDTHYYGILGFTRGDIDYDVSGTAGGDTIAISDQSDYDGYVLGVGVERAIDTNLSLTLEYEFTRFDSRTLTDAGGSSTRATPSYSNIRFGLNYAF